ncbi:MAG: hypothetical protein R2706_08170 [Acidimicrobiales bacterium]
MSTFESVMAQSWIIGRPGTGTLTSPHPAIDADDHVPDVLPLPEVGNGVKLAGVGMALWVRRIRTIERSTKVVSGNRF